LWSSRSDQEWGFLHARPISPGAKVGWRLLHVHDLPVALVQYFRATVCGATGTVDHVILLTHFPPIAEGVRDRVQEAAQGQFAGATLSCATEIGHEPSHHIDISAASASGDLAFAAAVLVFAGTLDDVHDVDVTIGSTSFRVGLAYAKGRHQGSVVAARRVG
jgi:hypothetical protein